MMKRNTAIALVCTFGVTAIAQIVLPGTASVLSASGQFAALAPRRGLPPSPVSDLATNAQYVHLEPALLAVYCERIKQELWRELDVTAPWRGRIELALRPAQVTNEAITVVSQRFTDNWIYHVELPDTVERARFVRVVVQVLLLEYANRSAGAHSAEIPTFLAEGLSQQLTTSREVELVLEPPRRTPNGFAVSRAMFEGHKPDPLENARRQLHEQPPLTLEELSWPAEGQLTGKAGETFRSSAQLFVNELLALNDGRACLRATLEAMPQYYNWQTAFLRGFRSHFERQLDVEKWWALQSAHFASRETGRNWTPEESWNKLDEIVCTPVQWRVSAVKLPAHAVVTLQTIIRDWDSTQQAQTLGSKLRDLEMARLRAAQELAGLADEYQVVLSAYLQRLDQLHAARSAARLSTPAFKRVVAETVKQLDALEAKRQALRPASTTVSAINAESGPVNAP